MKLTILGAGIFGERGISLKSTNSVRSLIAAGVR